MYVERLDMERQALASYIRIRFYLELDKRAMLGYDPYDAAGEAEEFIKELLNVMGESPAFYVTTEAGDFIPHVEFPDGFGGVNESPALLSFSKSNLIN